MIKEIHLATYPVRLMLCTSYEETAQMYAAFDCEFKSKGAAFVERLDSDNIGAIFVLGFCDYETALDNGILCHELIHLKNRICQLVGTQIDFDNDEPEAYFFGYLFETLSKIIRHEDMPEIQSEDEDSMVHFIKYGAPSESDTV